MDFSLKLPTRHAPAEREPFDHIAEDRDTLFGVGAAGPVLDAMPQPTAMLNECRQIIFANRAFLEFAGPRHLDEVLGLRLGEVLGCSHALEDQSGCGTHPSCQQCGAVNAVLRSLQGVAVMADVKLELEIDGGDKFLRFELSTTPVTVSDHHMVLLTIDRVRRPSEQTA